MTAKMDRETRIWFAIAMVAIVLLAAVLGEATHSITCSIAKGDADCDADAVAAFAGTANGAVFDRINLAAGHVPLVDQGMEVVARYGVVAIAGLVALSWFVRIGTDLDRRLAVYTAVLSAALALAAAIVIQHLYVHQRPFVLRSDVALLIEHGADPSFPSEHSAVAFALATGVGLYRPRFGVTLLIVACLIAFSRVYVGVHYPADVGGGALVGIVAAGALWTAKPALAWLDTRIAVRVLPRPLR